MRNGRTDVDPELSVQYPADNAGGVPEACSAEDTPTPLDVSPLEPWLNMAERLLMPVAVDGHHVDVDMKVLAGHLDSPNPVVRANLQRCIIDLHEAGYRLRNRPHLTHREVANRDD